jgi:hypothetical protein
MKTLSSSKILKSLCSVRELKLNESCSECILNYGFISKYEMPVTVAARSKGGRTAIALRQASRHETEETKADVSIMIQTGVRRLS